MRILEWNDIISREYDNKFEAAITIGVFDGLHIGHQKLIESINKKGIQSVVVTFSNNPARVFGKKTFKGDINSISQKLTNFKLYGIDILVLIDFSLNFSKITGKEFWKYLENRFLIRKVAIGENFYFGKDREIGGVELKQILQDVEVETVDAVKYRDFIVSSTKIRELIQAGDIDLVNHLLYKKFSLDLSDMEIDTTRNYNINAEGSAQVLPPHGLYSVIFNAGLSNIKGEIEIQKGNLIVTKPGKLNLKEVRKIIFIKKKA